MVDLRTCKPGDKLRSTHGMILTYVGPLEADNYMDHEVRYPDGARGTRTHDGFVFRNKRLPEDHDIAEILPNAALRRGEPVASNGVVGGRVEG